MSRFEPKSFQPKNFQPKTPDFRAVAIDTFEQQRARFAFRARVVNPTVR